MSVDKDNIESTLALDSRRRGYPDYSQDEVRELLQSDTRKFVQLPAARDSDKTLEATRFALITDRVGDIVEVLTYPAKDQPLLDTAAYVLKRAPKYGDGTYSGYLDADLRYVPWRVDGDLGVEYEPIEEARIYKIDSLMASDLESSGIFKVLEYIREDSRRKIYNKIPRRLRLDPDFNTEDPYREINPVDSDNLNDPGVVIPGAAPSRRDIAPPFTFEELTGDLGADPEIADEGYTGQTYDVSNVEALQALREAFENSSAFEQFEYDPADMLDKAELRAAQTELFDRLQSAGFQCKRFTRGRNFRCDLADGVRIAIEDPYLEAEIRNIGDGQIPEDLNAVVAAYNEWTIPHSLNVEMRVHEALLPTLEAWLSENQIRIVRGTARAIYELDDEVDQEAAIDAEVELRQRALDELLAVAEAGRDSTAIGEIEAEKSALAHAHAEFKIAAEAGDTIDHSDPDEAWGDSDLAEPTFVEEFERIIESIDIDKKTEALVKSLYDDLEARGLGRYADDSIVRVNRLNGEVYLPSGVEGYLEGIALPFGLTFDERREFVKAIKTFEERKFDINKEVLAELVRWEGYDEAALLAMDGIPQFTVREDYLNTYVERAQPGEIPALEHAVEQALADFEAEPTKEKVFNLKPMIESLFRYDPAKPKYHDFLDRMCEAGDAVSLWAESVRRKMPLIERTQSKAASVYGEEGYVPVIEDPLAGLDVFARNVATSALRFARDENSEYYGLFDPDMYLDFFEDRGAGVAGTYLSRKGLEGLIDCTNRGRSYVLEYGNFDRPTMDHRYTTQTATDTANANLEYVAKSIFDNISEVYDMYAFATDLEVVVEYGANVSVDFVAEDPNTIGVVFGSRITQLDIDFAYTLLCEYIAEVIVTQEPDLDPEDANLDGADILNLMRIPKPPHRLKPSSVRDIMRVFDDLEDISKYTQSGEFDQDLEDLRDLYEECMGMPVSAWDLSQYVGETAEEANERRKTFAALIGLNPYLPYDISIALDDDDYADLSRAVQYALREALTTFDETEEDLIFDLVRRRVRDAYRAIVFPKYFPKDKVRVVHVTYREADDFTRKHHSLQGGDDKKINPKGLELTIGAEVDGKLVAVATANSVSAGFKNQMSITDLSRVASDGSVKGVSSLLAGIVLKLTLENKFNRDLLQPPRFITYSTLDEVGSTYMALLGMGLRPTHLSPPGKPGGARKRSKIADVYKHYKLRWEAGESAEPANLDLARFLKMSYASDLEKDDTIAKVGEPWGDDYICICILNTVTFSMFCAEYVKTLKESFTPWPTSAETRRIRRELLKAAPTQIARSDRRRVKNIEKFLKPFQVCDEIEGTSPVTQEGRKIIVRCILAIKGRISETDTPDGCSKSEMIADLTEYEKSLPTFKKKKR